MYMDNLIWALSNLNARTADRMRMTRSSLKQNNEHIPKSDVTTSESDVTTSDVIYLIKAFAASGRGEEVQLLDSCNP